jgi:alpha-mannosidase
MEIMKTSQIIVYGALGLLFAICITSCSMRGSSSQPAAATAAPTAESGPAAKPATVQTAESGMANAPSNAGAVPVSLVSYFDVNGIVPDNSQFSEGLDGGGFACSSNILRDSFVWKGVPFQLGTPNPGSNVVSCTGQSIPLPAGKFSKLEMLATGVNGAQESQTFTITYSDSSLNQTNTQSVSDWYQPDGYSGESQAINMDYRDQSDGTRDDEPFYIYGYTFNLNPAGTATSLLLPSDNNVKVFAITLVP